jgi:predicted lipoprotein with Yx(FWY)xxD motif
MTDSQKPDVPANLVGVRPVDRKTESPEQRSFRMRRPTIHLALLAVAVIGLLAPAATGAVKATKKVAKEAESATLGKTILTTLKGRTLYSLSAETGGKFICTGSCLSTWRPLLVARTVQARGPVYLSQVKRPDGRTQVTYKDRPLYTFSGDTKAGDVNGQGIKDVGTWRAAVTGKLPSAPPPQPEPSPYPDPYPY